MTLSSGTYLGPYQVIAPLGAGGMGEVYRARDTKLNREVALKVLPEAFAADVERMARFEREACVLASLNHPNIASIYGLEESNGERALVMELVEGPTLAERIQSGPVALEDALPIARQIAEALEYAHEKGIIHRDLKPANIKLNPIGTVKVLDFGLAKAIEEAPAAAELTKSPTLSLAATKVGIILGTAAYMSPEQARGKTVDRGADIWAFGVVLFEMLSGRRPFEGEDVSDTLARVIREEPDWKALPVDAPARIRELLDRCLRKDPKQRLQAIGDARVTIEEQLSNPGTIPAALRSASKGTRVWKLATGASILMLVLVLASMLPILWRHLREGASQPADVIRVEVQAPPEITEIARFVISPDGRQIVFQVPTARGNSLWVRPLAALAARELPATTVGGALFWSPDSRYVGFFAEGKLKSIDVGDSTVETLGGDSSISIMSSYAWGPGGVIVMGIPDGISRLNRSDGHFVSLAKNTRAFNIVPTTFLPDGRHFLAFNRSPEADLAGTYVVSIDGGQTQRVLNVDSPAQYSSGFLLFSRENSIFAQPFDADRFRVTGDPKMIVQPGVEFSTSLNGVLVYRYQSRLSRFLWLDRTGRQIAVVGDPGIYPQFDLSPDGSRVVVSRQEPSSSNQNLWIMDAIRGGMSRLTTGTSNDVDPRWSPDGQEIIFGTTRDPSRSPFRISANGGQATLVIGWDKKAFSLDDWSPDGKYLLCKAAGIPEFWAIPLSGDRKPFLVIKTLAERIDQGQFSPDGRWIAFNSNESGRYEVWVAPFPSTGEKWQISTGGGMQPRWRGDGKELFYLSPDGMLTAVDIRTNGKVEPSATHALFPTHLPAVGFTMEQYAVTRDGQRFLLTTPVEQSARPSFTVVVNWPALLNK